MAIQRALLSVSDKSGILPFAQSLQQRGIELLSTGGTAQYLRENGVEVVEVSDFAQSPELFGGRIKTIHPKIHGALLYDRDDPEQQAQAKEHGIEPIDLVVVNLYPFEKTIAREEVTIEEAIEQIDIGGPAMLRAAAKNYRYITVVTEPQDYQVVLDELDAHEDGTTLKLRERLAIKVFQRTQAYDLTISKFLHERQETASSFSLHLPTAQHLRYGENPHQKASLYGHFGNYFTQLHGKELSYNNILDISSAVHLIAEFADPTVAILKHNNPCGVGMGDDLRDAWEKAYETDRQAPFGGIIVANRPLDEKVARVIQGIFSEVIVAPDFTAEARALLQKKKNLRLLKMEENWLETLIAPEIRSVVGGLLVQETDAEKKGELSNLEEKVVTARPPSVQEVAAMIFAWKVVKHVKSNAIVFANADRTLGIGAGQMSRVDSAQLAIWKAKEAGLSLEGSAVASDAFFPFPDALHFAIEAGASAAIQPGGSKRDEEVIAEADRGKLAMVCTGVRHFKH